MKRIWIAFIVLAALGSTYPFNFQWVPLDDAVVAAFLQSCCGKPGRGDVLGNVLLFLPIGFVGMFALQPRAPLRKRLLFLSLAALALSVVLQFVQIYLPSRDENLQDVLWNTTGTLAGAAIAVLADRCLSLSDRATFETALVPFALIATWLTYRLMPFVPSLDWQLIKNSIKPLLNAEFSLTSLALDVSAWLVIGYLLRAIRPGATLQKRLLLLIAAVFILEIIIVGNTLNLSDVVAAMIASAALPVLMRSPFRAEGLLVALMLVGFLLTSLSPFSLSDTGSRFSWLPFYGFLGGSMYVNAVAAAKKVFLFGSMVYLLRRLSVGYLASVLLLFGTVFVVEVFQTRLVGHTPEITDPILVLLAALGAFFVDRGIHTQVAGDGYSREIGCIVRIAKRAE